MNRALPLVMLALGLGFAAGALADEPAAAPVAATPPATRAWAEQTVKTVCAACHGADAAHPTPLPGNPPPILAGEYPDYLMQALKEYRDGQRQNIIMAPQAKDLSDAQIRALAYYLSSLPSPLHMLPRP